MTTKPTFTESMLRLVNIIGDPASPKDEVEKALANPDLLKWASLFNPMSDRKPNPSESKPDQFDFDSAYWLIEDLFYSKDKRSKKVFPTVPKFLSYAEKTRLRTRSENRTGSDHASLNVSDWQLEKCESKDEGVDSPTLSHDDDGPYVTSGNPSLSTATSICSAESRRTKIVIDFIEAIRDGLNIDASRAFQNQSATQAQLLESHFKQLELKTLVDTLTFLKKTDNKQFCEALTKRLLKLLTARQPLLSLQQWLLWCEKHAFEYGHPNGKTLLRMLHDATAHVEALSLSPQEKFTSRLNVIGRNLELVFQGHQSLSDDVSELHEHDEADSFQSVSFLLLKSLLSKGRFCETLDTKACCLFDATFEDRFLALINHWETVSTLPERIQQLAQRLSFLLDDKTSPVAWPEDFSMQGCWDEILERLEQAIEEVDSAFMDGSPQEKLLAFRRYLELNSLQTEGGNDLDYFDRIYTYFANHYTVNVAEYFSNRLRSDISCRWEAMEAYLWQGRNRRFDTHFEKANLAPPGLKEMLRPDLLQFPLTDSKTITTVTNTIQTAVSRLRKKAWQPWSESHRDILERIRSRSFEDFVHFGSKDSDVESLLQRASLVNTFGESIAERNLTTQRTNSIDFGAFAQEIVGYLTTQPAPSAIIVPIDVREREYRDLQREVSRLLRDQNYRVALARAPFQLMSEFGGVIQKPRLNAGDGTRKKYSAMKPEIVIADCRHDSLENYLEDLSANSRIAYDAYDMSEQVRVVFVSPTETINYDRFDCPVMEFALTATFERAASNSENPAKLIEEIGRGTKLGELLNCVITAGVWHTRLPKTLLERILACDSQTLDKLLRSGREYGLAEVDQNDLDTACISFADSSIPEQCWPQLASSIPMADLIRKILRNADPCVRAERVTILALLTRIATRGKYLVQYGLGTADFSRWLKDNRVDLQRLIFAPDCNGDQKFICERSEAIAWMRLFVDTYQFDEAMQIATALDATRLGRSGSYTRQYLCLQHELLFRWAVLDTDNRKKIHVWLANADGQIELDREKIGKHIKLSRYHLALGEYNLAWDSVNRAIRERELITDGENLNLRFVFLRWRALATKANICLEWPDRTLNEVDSVIDELASLLASESVPKCFSRRFTQELNHLCAKRDWFAGETEGALKRISEILRSNPRDFVAMSFMGTIQRQSEDFDEAQRSFEQVLAICPDNHYGLLGLGETYAEMGRTQIAQTDIADACTRFKDAKQKFELILDMHSGHVPALVAAARLEMDHASALAISDSNEVSALRDSSKQRLGIVLRLESANQRALVSLANWHIQFSDADSYNSFRREISKKNLFFKDDPIWLSHDLTRLRRAFGAESPSGLKQGIRALEDKIHLILGSHGQSGTRQKYSAATCRMLRQMIDSRGSAKPFDI